MATQQHYYIRKKRNKLKEIFEALLYMIIFPFSKYCWYKKIEDNSVFFTYGGSRSYSSSSWEFRWQRLFNLLLLIAIILCIVL